MADTWITETGLKILETLEVYQYMTCEQIKRAGSFKNLAVVQRTAKSYVEHRPPLLHFKDFGCVPGLGRLHKIYALTEHGAEVLAEAKNCDLSDITYLTGKIQFSLDYMHRLQFVNTHITVREWAKQAGAEMLFFTAYFETVGANRTSKDVLKLAKKNRIELSNNRNIVPDGLFSFIHGDKKRLCALEVHRGKDTKLILEQLNRHIEALYLRAIQDRYQHDTANFILSVYEEVGTMEAVKRRIKAIKDFDTVARAFHFTTLDKLQADITTAWSLADGSAVSLFK